MTASPTAPAWPGRPPRRSPARSASSTDPPSIRSWSIAKASSGAVTWTGTTASGKRVADGAYTIRISGRDAAGNAATRSVAIRVDRTIAIVHWAPASFFPQDGDAIAATAAQTFKLGRTAKVSAAIYSGTTARPDPLGEPEPGSRDPQLDLGRPERRRRPRAPRDLHGPDDGREHDQHDRDHAEPLRRCLRRRPVVRCADRRPDVDGHSCRPTEPLRPRRPSRSSSRPRRRSRGPRRGSAAARYRVTFVVAKGRPGPRPSPSRVGTSRGGLNTTSRTVAGPMTADYTGPTMTIDAPPRRRGRRPGRTVHRGPGTCPGPGDSIGRRTASGSSSRRTTRPRTSARSRSRSSPRSRRATLLVVDDGSPDGTGRIADDMAGVDARIRVRHRAAKQGLGRAYLDGFWRRPRRRRVDDRPDGRRLVARSRPRCRRSSRPIEDSVRRSRHRVPLRRGRRRRRLGDRPAADLARRQPLRADRPRTRLPTT